METGSSDSLFSEMSSFCNPASLPIALGSVEIIFLCTSSCSRPLRRQMESGRNIKLFEWRRMRRNESIVPISDGILDSRFFSNERVRRFRSLQSGARASSPHAKSFSSKRSSDSTPKVRHIETDRALITSSASPPSPVFVASNTLSGACTHPSTMALIP